MPTLHSHLYSSEGEGPWWGLRVASTFYSDHVRRLEDASRCFVYLVNERGDSAVVAVEGPHRDSNSDLVFCPEWVLRRLGVEEGAEIMMDPIYEALPKGETVKIKPMTYRTVEGPMFLEGLTEALNQLGVVQEGQLSAIVDPSTGEVHEFLVEDLKPASVCLADGELTVDLQPADDIPPTPPQAPRFGPKVGNSKDDESGGDTEENCCCGGDSGMLSFAAVVPPVRGNYQAFSGIGHRLTDAASDHGASEYPPPRPRHDRGDHPLLRKIRAEAESAKTDT
jgi:hypothetical protein